MKIDKKHNQPPPGAGDIERHSPNALVIDRHIPALMSMLAGKFSAGGAAVYRPAFGIGITEWRLMAQLAGNPWPTATELGAITGLDKAAVSRSLRTMQDRGLVDVHADARDQRRQRMALTPAGLALHDRIVSVANARERKLLEVFSAAEREQFLDFLSRLKDQVKLANAIRPK